VKNQNILLPAIEKKNYMNFFSWKKNQVLFVNKFGMLEPDKTIKKIPNLILVPILAYDEQKYRLGYGKGFYDIYLNKYLKKFKNILTVGVAFSFQKYHKLPRDKKDVKLNYILTEKGIY
jgi:5-formyltetrahydrofolate cyclo-ligase